MGKQPIEAWGRGIEKMKKGCVDDNLSEPEFEVTPTMFSICFRIRDNNKVMEEQSRPPAKPVACTAL